MIRASLWIALVGILTVLPAVGCRASSGTERGANEPPTSPETGYDSLDQVLNRVEEASNAVDDWIRTEDFERTHRFAETLEVYCGDLIYFVPTNEPVAVQRAYRERAEIIHANADAVRFATRLRRMIEAEQQLMKLNTNVMRLREMLNDPSQVTRMSGGNSTRITEPQLGN